MKIEGYGNKVGLEKNNGYNNNNNNNNNIINNKYYIQKTVGEILIDKEKSIKIENEGENNISNNNINTKEEELFILKQITNKNHFSNSTHDYLNQILNIKN